MIVMSRIRIRWQRLHHGGNQAGFTLVELLITMTLLLVVGGIVTSGVTQALATSRRGQARVYALADLETAGQRVTRELRAAIDFDQATGDAVTVDVLRNGGREKHAFAVTTSAGGERQLSHTRSIYATVDAATPTSSSTRVLIGEVDAAWVAANPVFTYERADGSPWVASAHAVEEIARAQVTLVRDLPEQGNIQVQTAVYVRNSE